MNSSLEQGEIEKIFGEVFEVFERHRLTDLEIEFLLFELFLFQNQYANAEFFKTLKGKLSNEIDNKTDFNGLIS